MCPNIQSDMYPERQDYSAAMSACQCTATLVQGHSVFQFNTNKGQCQFRLSREAAAGGRYVGVAGPSQQPNRGIAQCCHYLGNAPTADLRTVFIEGHIANPM